ncbi:MAG: PQQ-binding-like beta-propeller repeat protein, partial [Tepidisphaeraceae bacterium]
MLFEQYEKRAADAVEALRTGSDPGALVDLAQAYPNSAAARDALWLAGEAYESSSNPRMSAQVFRQLYAHSLDPQTRARVIEALARSYLAMPNRLDVAAARLAQGARLPGEPRLTRALKLPDGQTIPANSSFADALAVVRRCQVSSASQTLPDLGLAERREAMELFLAPTPDSTIDGVAALVLPLRDFTRHDCVVTYSPASGLSCFSASAHTPRFSSTALGGAPRSVAWTSGNLLAWDDAKVVMLDGASGQTVWEASPRALPTPEPLADAVAVVNEESSPNQQNMAAGDDARAAVLLQVRQANLRRQMVLRRRMVIGPGQQVQIVNAPGVAVAQALPDPPAPEAGGNIERIVDVRPLSDRAIVATSTGRIAAFDLIDGRLLWQTQAADAQIDRLVVNEDFVVVRSSDPSAMQLVALEALNGQAVLRRSFARENGSATPLVNIALASDGTLVWLMPDTMVAKDLFEPGDAPRFQLNRRPRETGGLFGGALAPDQLIITDGRVVVVAEDGMNVHVRSLETGEILRGN